MNRSNFAARKFSYLLAQIPLTGRVGPRLNLKASSGGSEGVRTSMVRRRNESHRRLGHAPAAMQPGAVEMCLSSR